MEDTDDLTLLARYAEQGDQTAFATVVSRRIGFVYGAALRQVHDSHSAQEVTQAVFLILAQKAGSLGPGTILLSWLFKTVRFTAIAQIRAEARRRNLEQKAIMEQDISSQASGVLWEKISPLLDKALARLGEKDRQAVLLRFFEEKNFLEIGHSLGADEDAARMRINRALEKLRGYFHKHNVASTTALLAQTMTAHGLQPPPAFLVKSITVLAVAKGTALSGSAAALTKATANLMTWAKVKATILVASGAVIVVGGGALLLQETETRNREQQIRLEEQQIRSKEQQSNISAPERKQLQDRLNQLRAEQNALRQKQNLLRAQKNQTNQ
jgi:RNA polymerase sigma factor (sigma-70 family)